MRLKWAIVGCIVLAGSAAYAETSKPRNILEYLFGTKKAEQPAAIAPAPNVNAGAKAAVKAAKQQAIDGEPKRSIRKAKPNAGDGEKRTASAGGSYRGGGHAYCVRTCDGFFFPISHEGAQGNDRYASACQQSCPGAETQVYFMKRGGDIRWASNARGYSYSGLENALKYRKERDPACSCKSQNQSWGTILAAVEPGIRPHKGDLVVTEDISRRIAQGEDAMAIAKANEQQGMKQADASAGAKRAEAPVADSTPKTLRSSFGDKITPANKFIKIDPDTTGSIAAARKSPAPAATESSTPAVPAAKREAKPAKPEAKAPASNGKPAAKSAVKATQPAAAIKTAAKVASVKVEKAEARPAGTVLAAATKATAKAGGKPGPDKLALRETLERLSATNKRQ